MTWIRDQISIINHERREGEQRGIQKGLQEGKQEDALKMIVDGMDINKVAYYNDLSVTELIKLKKQIQ